MMFKRLGYYARHVYLDHKTFTQFIEAKNCVATNVEALNQYFVKAWLPLIPLLPDSPEFHLDVPTFNVRVEITVPRLRRIAFFQNLLFREIISAATAVANLLVESEEPTVPSALTAGLTLDNQVFKYFEDGFYTDHSAMAVKGHSKLALHMTKSPFTLRGCSIE